MYLYALWLLYNTENDVRLNVFCQQILHSIFFLGAINTPRFFPGDIVSHDQHMLDALRRCYPGPFRCCSSELPKRSPFSCVLDMVRLQFIKTSYNNSLLRCKGLTKKCIIIIVYYHYHVLNFIIFLLIIHNITFFHFLKNVWYFYQLKSVWTDSWLLYGKPFRS